MKNIQTQTSPYSILIINKNGITRLYCPFKVKALEDVFNLLSKGEEYHVEKVKIGSSEPLIYVVKGKDYPHRFFLIE